jgi:hypothetical protein
MLLEEKNLSEDCQAEMYLRAFAKSSSRVRYVIIAIAVTSILIFVGFINSREGGWTNNRLRLAHIALDSLFPEPHSEAEAAEPDSEDKAAASLTLSSPSYDERSRQRALDWVQRRNLYSRPALEHRMEELERAQIDNVIIMRMPVLGLAFDVNDLGMFSGIALSVLLIMLTFSIARYRENLFLSLWKAKEICRQEGRQDAGDSKANLLYHSLAMTQVFSSPLTLARWRRGRISQLVTICTFMIPLPVQLLIFCHDFSTMNLGSLFSNSLTAFSMIAQAVSILVVVTLCVVCLVYARANERQWRKAFFMINPSLKQVPCPSWWERVEIAKPRHDYQGLIVKARSAGLQDLSPKGSPGGSLRSAEATP